MKLTSDTFDYSKVYGAMVYCRDLCWSDVDAQQQDEVISRQNDVLDWLQQQQEVASVRNQSEYMLDINAGSGASKDGSVEEGGPEEPKANTDMEDWYNFG